MVSKLRTVGRPTPQRNGLRIPQGRLRRTKIVIASRGKDRCQRSEVSLKIEVRKVRRLEEQRTAVYAKLRRAKEVGGQRSIRRLHGLGKKVCFKRVALPSEFTRHVGNQDYLRGIYGLTVDGIVENTIALLERRISHRPTPNSALRATHGRQTHTDICSADLAEQK